MAGQLHHLLHIAFDNPACCWASSRSTPNLSTPQLVSSCSTRR
jgi:hypothetical protein